MKLLLVCGGQSTEHAVSRMSCVNIYKNADKTKYDIKVAGITKEGEWYDLVSTDFSSDNWLEGATKITDHFTFLKSFDHRSQHEAAGGSTPYPGVYGYEKYAALHFLHQFYRRK